MASYPTLVRAAFETARICVPTVVDAALNRTDYDTCSERLFSWAHRLVRHARIDLHVHGAEHIVPGRSYVVMSNHQGLYDVPVLFESLRIPLRMVAKAELFRIPLFGRAMLESGFVELDRKNRRRAMESMQLAKRRLSDDGLSVWIAPEGTRSVDGKLHQFKRGGFHLALATGATILPVTIRGTIDVHRSGDNKVYKGRRVDVDVHAPVQVDGYSRQRIEELMDRVWHAINSTLEAAPAVQP